MKRLRRMARRQPSYERLNTNGGFNEPESRPLAQSESEPEDDGEYSDGSYDGPVGENEQEAVPQFSWLVYSVFTLLGMAMLWSWNMFLAAGPYFQKRFKSSDWILTNFQSTELTVSTLANLGTIIVLTNMQAKASYTKRIVVALGMNSITFTLLAASTKVFADVSAGAYFAFLIIQVLLASIACGIMQNGIFAYVSGFGREEYTQGIMTGQAVAGVLPCVVQILSVLSAPDPDDNADFPEEKSSAAMAYFLTATAISLFTIAAFFYLANRHSTETHHHKGIVEDLSHSGILSSSGVLEQSERQPVALRTLFRKTFWLAISVLICFAVTMMYPVFTQKILSIEPVETAPPILRPASFIPLALLFWNSGDLIGRLLTAFPALRIAHQPRLVFSIACARLVFIPLYLLCNIKGEGAKINSDTFYLVGVELLFGVSNGFIGSTCMMGAVEYVDVEEREATGGFMGLMLVAGLSTGMTDSLHFNSAHGRKKVQRNGVAPPAGETSGKIKAEEDAFDFSGLQAKILKATEHLAHQLAQLKAGGRFNPERLEELRVSLKATGEGGSTSSRKLKDLAQVVAKGRNISVICHEDDQIKAINTAILTSNLNLTPHGPSPEAPTTLLIQIPPPTGESRQEALASASGSADEALGKIREARGGHQKKLRAMQVAKKVRPDDLQKAQTQMETVVKGGNEEVKKMLENSKRVLEG